MNVSFCAVTEMKFVFSKEVNYGKSLEFVEKGFSPQCLCVSDQCYESEIANPYNQDLNLIIRYVFYVEYVLGGIAIVLNLLVMLTIMMSRTLKKPSFIMICNIALCDLFIGVYSILTGRFTYSEFIVNEKKYENLDVFVNHYCTARGFLFTTSQMVAVPTTLLMSIERYLSIVYGMDPTKRLRERKTFILIVMFWLCGLSYASFPIFRVGGLRQHGEYTCTLPFVDGEDHMKVNSSTLVIAVVLAMMYLAGSCLYIPIYKYVKTTNSSAGVKRKAALARNIAIMITTNFVFFLLPLISILIFVYSYKSFAELLGVDTLKEVQTYLICLSWLPVVLFSVNSCLNPFLCAFRHPKFKSQLILLRNILPKTRETSGLPVDVPGNSMPANKSTDGIELGITNSTLRISMETITAL